MQVPHVKCIKQVIKLAANRPMSLGSCKKSEKVAPGVIAPLSEFSLAVAEDSLSKATLSGFSELYVNSKQVPKNDR